MPTDGFLGARGSFMLDAVVTSMIIACPLLLWSVFLVRRGHYAAHRRIQLTLGTILLIAVTLFEIEMRVFGWQHRAEQSSYWQHGPMNDAVDYSLAMHLMFAIPTPFFWLAVTWFALRRFSKPPCPGVHSDSHRFWGRLSVSLLVLTAFTGWIFYWCAFVA